MMIDDAFITPATAKNLIKQKKRHIAVSFFCALPLGLEPRTP